MADQKNLTCTVCLEVFKEPKVLPCCHTFCKSCLDRVFEGSSTKETLSCPQCRGEHAVPANGTEGLLTEYTIASELLANGLNSSKRKPLCGECDSDDPAVAYCRDCQTHLCDYCSGGHKRMKRFRDHKLISLGSLTPDVLKQSRAEPTCRVHADRPLVAFCKTCEGLVCNDCIVTTVHEGHKYCAVDGTTRTEVESGLKEHLDGAKAKLTNLREDLQYIKMVEQQAGKQAANLKTAINETFDALVASLEARRKALLQEAESKSGGDLEKVCSEKELVQMAVSNLETTVGFTERVLQCSSDAEFLSLGPQASSRLSELEGTKWDNVAVKAIKHTTREFVGSQSKATELQGFGKVNERGRLQVHGPTKTYMLGSQHEFTVASERGFELVKVVVQGYYGRSQKQFVLHPTQKTRGKWAIPFTPVCSGQHTLTLSVDGREVKGSPFKFTVQGTPAKGNRVITGPDWPADSPTSPGAVGTVAFSRHSAPGYVTVRWSGDGELCQPQQFRWGAEGRYEVQLVR